MTNINNKIKLSIFLYFISMLVDAQTPLIDSLKLGLKRATDDTTKINFLNELSWEYAETNEINKAVNAGNEALNLSNKINFTKGIATANARLGNVFFTTGEYDKALNYHLNALKIKEKSGDKKGVAATCQNIANIFQQQANATKAIEYYLKSLKIKEELGDKKGIGNSLNGIGNIYKDLGNYKKALDYFNQSLVIRKEINDLNGMAYTYSNIATIYGMQKDYKQTLEYSEKGLEILEKLGNKNGIASCLAIIANVHKAEKNYKKAQEYNFKALTISEEISNKYTTAMCLVNIGNVYFLDNNPQKGIDYMNKGLAVAKELGAKDYIKGTYLNLAEAYEQISNHKKALEYYKLYSELKDSIINDETNKELAEKTALYNSEKKEKEISLLKAEKEKQAAIAKEEKEKQLVITGSISALLIMVLLFLFYLFIAYQKKQKANQLLQYQKHLIDEKNTENETLLAEIHHRVKNNLQVISSLLSLQGKSITDPGARVAIEDGKQRVKSMELVHKMLYEGSSFSSIEMNDYTNKLVQHLSNAFGIDNSKIDFKTNSSIIKLDIDTAIPIALILNELIINALKYAYTESRKLQLTLSIMEENNTLKLFFSDNGTEAKAEKIANSKSFGSKLIQLLTKQLNGEIDIKDNNGMNYTFIFKEYKIIK